MSAFRAVEQNRNHRDVAGQRGAYFDAHEIFLIVEPSPACLWISRIGPTRAHENKQYIALLQPTFQDSNEIYPKWDRINIHEDVFARQSTQKRFIDPLSLVSTVVAAITDENLPGHYCLRVA